jgi:hypothetical protein
LALVRAASIVLSHPLPSSALRPYCLTSLSEDRMRIADVVSVGESDGRFSTRPVDSCS